MDGKSSAAAARIVASLATKSVTTPDAIKLPGEDTPAKQLLEAELRSLAERVRELQGNASIHSSQNLPQTTVVSNASGPAKVVAAERPAEVDESSKEPDTQDGIDLASFFAQMSGEIRTPINAILGMTHMVLDTELTAYQREMLKTAHESASCLLSLATDMMDVCRVESKAPLVANYPYRLGQTVLDALESLAVKAQEKLQTVTFNVDQSVPDYVLGDSSRLGQAIKGFVHKAMDLSEKGQDIILSVTNATNEGKGGCMLEFTIEISKSGGEWGHMDQYLDKVQQASGSNALEYSELGLYISTRLIHLMGGTLWTTREAPDCKLHFTCRAEPAPEDDESVKQRLVPLHNRRVIIVNPRHSNFGADTSKLLQQMGLRTEVVDADKLASAVRQRAKARIILPWDTLIVDSIDTAKNLRALSGIKSNPIVAFVNRPFQVSIEPHANLDVTSCITASSSLESLRNAIVDSFNYTPKLTPAPDLEIEPLNILLAEDNAVNQKVVVKLLQKHKCTVTLAANGAEAVEVFKAKRFDAILMDTEMPVMGGVEAAVKIREYEQNQRIRPTPIIGLWSHNTHSMDEWAQVPVDGYLVKPLRRNDIVEALRDAIAANTRTAPEIPSRL